jgi:hypothetical protein
MAEELLGPDGKAIDIDAAEQDFHAAMAAPEPDQAPDYPAPPQRDYGTKEDGTPKKAAGRPRTSAEKPRTTGKVPPPPAKGKSAGKDQPAADYTETLTSFGSAVWMGLAALPVTHAQALAAVWKHQLGAQVHAWNAAAQQDPGVRRAVEKLSAGPTWVVGIAIATAPLVGAGVAIMRDPQIRADLAKQTRAEFAEFLSSAAAEGEAAEPERAAA